ncbi:MAG TPA: hypothetical protein VFB63_25715 [Bryobacteraceae bacterium]|nr:hypothetical protein [Bryobacteraceae bacterium]
MRGPIISHLESVLASSVFRNSKRYASVLRYVVVQTLEGRAEQLKERTIGVEVFGRPPDYDTAADHVVRSAVAEIRKRLAQYYQGSDAAGIRIELQLGSYVPLFRIPAEHAAPDNGLRPVPIPEPEVAAAARPGNGVIHGRWVMYAGTATAAVLVIAIIAISSASSRASDPLDAFWRPVLSSSHQVLLCVGNLEQGQRYTTPPDAPPITLGDFHRLRSQAMHIADATTLSRLAGLLHARGKPYRIGSQSEVTFADLQGSSAVLIGLFNNDWTERLVGKRRFSVERTANRRVVIRDSENPHRDWSVDYSTPFLQFTKDYALVLRVMDPKTGQMVVTAAGITVFGTEAAGVFLTSGNELRKLKSVAPDGWERKNMEIILSTDVIRGKSGLPSIVATHFW